MDCNQKEVTVDGSYRNLSHRSYYRIGTLKTIYNHVIFISGPGPTLSLLEAP